jgi:Cu(I)/Ag(I) efflux system membrane protein CusA/SilA
MDKALQFPGCGQFVDDADPRPHRHAVHRHPHAGRASRCFGSDLAQMEKVAREIETVVRQVPAPPAASMPSASPVASTWTSSRTGRNSRAYGLPVGDLMDVVGSALGRRGGHHHHRGPGARFGVIVRLPARCALHARGDRTRGAGGPCRPRWGRPTATIPLGQVAQVRIVQGAPVIRTENSLLSAYIYVDIRERDNRRLRPVKRSVSCATR